VRAGGGDRDGFETTGPASPDPDPAPDRMVAPFPANHTRDPASRHAEGTRGPLRA
jgi:hypothetical protein